MTAKVAFIRFFLLSCLAQLSIFSLVAQPVSFRLVGHAGVFSTLAPDSARVTHTLYLKEKPEHPLYQERARCLVQANGDILGILGKGERLLGHLDSLNWSEGTIRWSLVPDSGFGMATTSRAEIIIRIPTRISNDNTEGFVEGKPLLNDTLLVLGTSAARPVKVSVDLSTNYVNVDYPADTYPIYRHFEWMDTDADGVGSALMLTYSDNTTHMFQENTHQLGEVKLYDKTFQRLYWRQSVSGQLALMMSKPEPVKIHQNTYVLRGGWKIIYYLEY